MFTKNHTLHIQNLNETGSFYGYASVFDWQDHHLDIIKKGAFKKSLQTTTPKMLWQHDPTQIIGHWTDIREDDYGLFVKGQLFLDLSKAMEAYILMSKGVLNGLSIGYFSIKQTPQKNHQGWVNIIEELELKEVSLVTFPANERANILQVKTMHQTIPPFLKQLDDLCQAFCNG